MKTLRTVTFATLLTLVGCKRYQPPTEVPPSPTIEAFTASATTVGAGEPVTLSWRVTHATSIELREATAGALAVPVDQLEGSIEVTPTATSLYVLSARGQTGSDARAIAVTVPPGSGAVSLQALPPVIMGGGESTLVWLAPGAREVTLTADGAPLELGGQVSSGAVTVRPLADTTYTLTVDGAQTTATVEVQPAILGFTAQPTAVEVGEPITLSWSSAGATRVELRSNDRGLLFESTGAEVREGTFTDTAPELPADAVVTYELVVEKGADRITRTLEVNVGTGLRIVRFSPPPVAERGGAYIMRWTTIAADEVQVRVDGAVTYSTTNPTQVAQGVLLIPTPAEDFSVELVASNTRGATASSRTQIDVVGTPTSVTLGASPTTVTAGASTTLTWSSPEARRVRITDATGQVVYSVKGQMAEAGSATVFPHGAGTTYTIAADNLLGSTPVIATATVATSGTPLTASVDVNVPASGALVTITASDPQATLVGFAHEQVLVGTTADFIDIRDTGEALPLASVTVTTVNPGFTTWLWGERVSSRLVVTRGGWMAFGGDATANVAESLLPNATKPSNIIAPFWDSLTMTSESGVYWQVVGDAPNERLIVQWDRMRVGSDANTEVTFQAQVHQNGTIGFQYGNMRMAPGYTAFGIGVQDGTKRRGISSDVIPASNSSIYFFSPQQGRVSVRAVRQTSLGGFVQLAGVSALVTMPSNAVSMPEDVALTEVLFKPAAAVAAGQYAEFLNRTSAPVDLTGWYLESPGGARFDFPSGFTLPPDVNVVVGASTDAAANDDAGVALSWGSFSLPADGGLLFMGRGDGGFNMAFSSGDAGVAQVVDPGFFRIGSSAVPQLVVCSANTTFGAQTPSQRGNPGVHAGCTFGYRSVAIAPHFVDITGTGALVTTPTLVETALTVPITLATQPTDPQPVLFGSKRPVVSMSLDGFIAPYSTTSTNATNKTTPSTTTVPRGVIAPFWDDLQTTLGLTPSSGMYWKAIAENEDPLRPERHWIFQWHRVRHLNTNPPDDLNFEVKLFENGVVEYHYATMASPGGVNYANGSTATVWLEQPDAGAALTQSVNTVDVRPNTATRFIPQ